MAFEGLRREHHIRKTLRGLARQRVAIILQPGNVWVIERAPREFDGIEEALRTCDLRGWVEPIENAIPHGKLTPNGRLPEGELFTGEKSVYRLTEAGWSALNRSHAWLLATFAIAAATLAATILGVWLTWSVNGRGHR